MARYKVITSGNSAVLVLPKTFREENGIEVGDYVEVGFPARSVMTVTPTRKSGTSKSEQFSRLFSFVDGAGKTGLEPLSDAEYRASMESHL